MAVSRLAAAAALSLAAGSALASGGSVWLQYGHDARQSNENGTETTLTAANVASLVPVWSGPAAATPLALPAVHRGELLGATSGLGLAAVSDTGGAARWSVPATAGGYTPSITADGTIMTYAYPSATGYEGFLTGVSTATGKTLWTVPLYTFDGTPGWTASTAIDGETVSVVTSNGFSFSYDVRDGGSENGASDMQWNRPLDPHAAMFGHWYFVVASTQRAVYQVHAHETVKRDREGWDALLGTATHGVASTPRIAGNVLVVSDSEGGVYAFQLKTGAPRWSVVLPTAPGTVPGVTATSDKTVYAVSHPAGAAADSIDALVTATGAQRWTSPLDGAARVRSNLALANGMVFAAAGATTCSTLVVLDAASGAPLVSLPTGIAADSGARCDLAVADGKVILHGQGAAGATLQVLGLPS
jgi:outer membrane protein assembly factor BamB